MEVVFTSWSLIVFLAVFASLGFAGWLCWRRHFKSGIAVVVIFALISVFKPVRFAVDDAPIQRSEQLVYERHSQLPEKVAVEAKSFNKVLEERGQQIKKINKETEREILGGSE